MIRIILIVKWQVQKTNSNDNCDNDNYDSKDISNEIVMIMRVMLIMIN